MTITAEIQRDLNSESSYTVDGTIVTCPNHFLRRIFRGWIDGSYDVNGSLTYRANCAWIREANKRKLRSFVISQFSDYIAHEYDCSRSTAQRAIVDSMPRDQLEALNEELIDDALDLIAD